MLFVGDDETEIAEDDILADKRVRADDQLRLAGGDLFARRALLRGRLRAGQKQNLHAERPKERRERLRMLLGEDLGRRHERRLTAVLDSAVAGGGRDHRLAAADVALHQPVHHMAGGQIGEDRVDGGLLRMGQLEGQSGIECRHALRLIRHGGKRRARRAQDGKTGGKDEKLLKDQPSSVPAAAFPSRAACGWRYRLR